MAEAKIAGGVERSGKLNPLLRGRGPGHAERPQQEQIADGRGENCGRCGAKRQKLNDPPVSLPRRLRAEPMGQVLFVGCQVLQLLTLEAASWKRLLLGA
jgi:hypothetical protein